MFQVFRIAGIPVRIDVSWLLVFALTSWSLAAGYFPQVLPALAPGAAWLHGVGAAALLFVSVFLHELAHALVPLGPDDVVEDGRLVCLVTRHDLPHALAGPSRTTARERAA